ncbi:hypothetical protein [Hymenobacter jeollabukensis]|uniref:DUF7847 domain-containing protein n=1 Tax=Hymenobacter jeollabukensis TaxID=2025313 RepID=A0A5R8WLD6_9BACT|nr:hypothetical protein [Hymenobacter jeollabukensis]TLM89975.1 hypothetical protein FDY95_18295 [Hymenobacter jeollabukensis]
MATPTPPFAYQSDAQRTFATPQDYYRLRDFGQKFEATSVFLRRHGGNLYRVMLLPLLVAIVPLATLMILFGRNFRSGQAYGQLGQGNSISLALMSPAIFGLVVLVLAAMLVQYAMLYGFVKRRMYQSDPTATISAGEAWDEGKRYLLPLIGYSIVAGVFVMIGYVLLILPGIYLSIAVLLLPCVVVFEEADLGSTLSRCLQLIRGKWWSTFGLYIVASIAMWMLAAGLGAVLTIVTALFGAKSADGEAVMSTVIVAQAVQISINLLLTPIIYVLLMFQYFNLVERRDHVSLQWRAEQLGQAPEGPGSPSGPAGPDDALFRPSYGDQAL